MAGFLSSYFLLGATILITVRGQKKPSYATDCNIHKDDMCLHASVPVMQVVVQRLRNTNEGIQVTERCFEIDFRTYRILRESNSFPAPH